MKRSDPRPRPLLCRARTVQLLTLAGALIGADGLLAEAPQGKPLPAPAATTATTSAPPVRPVSAAPPTASAPSSPAAHAPAATSDDALSPLLRRSLGSIAPNDSISRTNQNATWLWTKLEEGRRYANAGDEVAALRQFTALLEVNAPAELHQAALLEMANLAQRAGQLPRAQQIYAQYLDRFPGDPTVPDVILRQGLLYRQMGAHQLALAKFYSVMSTCLSMKANQLNYYQQLVLLAQTEIADTYYQQGQNAQAVEFLNRLLKLDATGLDKGLVRYKLLRSLSQLARHDEVIAHAQQYLQHQSGAPEEPEVRFLYVEALKKAGRSREALEQVLTLLLAQQAKSSENPETWIYWQQRTGNSLANELYREGDYLSALRLYDQLSTLSNSPDWQLPVWYQTALIYERLQQTGKSIAVYDRILNRQKEMGTNTVSPNLSMVFDMSRWRKEHLGYQGQSETNLMALRVDLANTNAPSRKP